MADFQYQQIQLRQYENVNSINSDISDKIHLEAKTKNLVSYDIIQSVNVAEQFEIERQNTLLFKIYGGLEYMSPLNNISTFYFSLKDFFNKQPPGIIQHTTFQSSFDVYLLRPYSAYTQLDSTKFIKRYEIIAVSSDIDIIDAGFGRNIFSEKKQIYMCPNNVDLNDRVDGFGKPITEVYLFFNYKSTENHTETVQKKSYNAASTDTVFNKVDHTYSTYSLGDIIDADLVTYEKENFLEETLNEQEHFITVTYTDVSAKNLVFRYKPFVKIPVRNFGAETIIYNATATTVETIIPSYAVSIGEGNYLWKELLNFGYVDPIEGTGNNFPFVNGTHYVHQNIVLSMSPDMTHANTSTVFNEISFNANQLINTIPNTGLNNGGVIC